MGMLFKPNYPCVDVWFERGLLVPSDVCCTVEMLRVWTTELQGVVGDECAQCIDEDIGSLLDLLLVQVTLDYAPPR